jgi:hypothetical protein
MRRAGSLAAALWLAVVMAAAPASAASNFRAHMTAEEEVPKRGPAGAKGTADLVFDQQAGTVCYTLAYTGISKPTAAHIHKGTKGMAGPVVVNFDVPKNGDRGCVPVEAAKSGDIMAYPDSYYVNVHTAEYQDGAIRGQVHPA